MQLQLQPHTRGSCWKGFRLHPGLSIGLPHTSPMRASPIPPVMQTIALAPPFSSGIMLTGDASSRPCFGTAATLAKMP